MDDPSTSQPSSSSLPLPENNPKDDNNNNNESTNASGIAAPKEDKPLELHQPSTSQENNDEEDTASRTIREWSKEHEINVLKEILLYYGENEEYPFIDNDSMQYFYNVWIAWRGVYVEEDAFANKIFELSERFFVNQLFVYSGLNAVASMESNDLEIYRLSYVIWGQEDEDEEDDNDDMDDGGNNDSNGS